MEWLAETRQFAQAVVSILAVVDPIGGLPVFMALTEGHEPHERRKLFRLAGLVAMIVVALMAVAGQFLLEDFFQIGLEEFAFGGGLLLIVVGIGGLSEMPNKTSIHADAAQRRAQSIRIAISPIAVPLLCGPGAIVTVMLIVTQRGPLYGTAAALAAFGLTIAILNWSSVIFRLLGEIGTLAIGRVMNIFIVAIGVRFAFDALGKVFPGLLH